MQKLKFEGSGFEYFKIWIVNILLTIVTVGFYYPWAKVRNNRYFYANSTLDGRNFEYHATGKQLFFGYLIALGLFITYTVVSSIFPVGGAIFLLILFLGFPWVIWRSLSFKLRMTSFSNVRFSFDGTMGGAYFNYMLLPIACFIAFYAAPVFLGVMFSMFGDQVPTSILGIVGTIATVVFFLFALYLYAFMKKKHTHYQLDGYRYGQGHFKTDVVVKPFAIILFKAMGLGILLFVVFMILMGIISYFVVGLDQLVTLQQSTEDPEQLADAIGSLMLIIVPVYLMFIFLSFLIFAYSYTRQRAYIYSNSVLDDKIKFASTLKARQFAWVLITNLLAVMFSFGLALPWAKVRMARLILENTQVDTGVGFEDYVTQKQKEQSSLGEQIGDAFDVDVAIGF